MLEGAQRKSALQALNPAADVNEFSWRGAYDWGDYIGYRLQPRTVGLQVGVNF